MKRLFTFGCSFTSYSWSTWADILGTTAEEFQNWGMSGTGNQFILASITECHQRNQFRPDDTVIVCWTNVMRDDRYTSQWCTRGNIYTHPKYDPAWVRQWITERGCLIRDLAVLSAVTHILKYHKVNWHFLSMVPFDQADQYRATPNTNQDLLSCSKRVSPIHSEIVDINKPCKTIICTYDHQPRLLVGLRKPSGISYCRTLLPDELKQIQGFPSTFKMTGSKKDQVTQIGNAVPPALIQSIAACLKSLL
jgi:hypothetical protein